VNTGQSVNPFGGFMEHVDLFDAALFGLSRTVGRCSFTLPNPRFLSYTPPA